MPIIKIHLEDEEYEPIRREAEAMHLQPEDVAYAGLNRIMHKIHDPRIRGEIAETHVWRRENLPSWSNCARSVHVYEGKPDDAPDEPS